MYGPYFRKVFYHVPLSGNSLPDENPWKAKSADLRSWLKLEVGGDSALMMPDQDRLIFKPNWWLASMIDDKRVGGGNPNAESLRGSHRSVVGECVA